MVDTSMIVLIMAILLFLMAIGVKVAWALGVAGLLVMLNLFGLGGLRQIGNIAWETSTSFTLTCVPLFIFMGEMLMRSGLSDSVFDGMNRFTRGLPGGILQATLASCGVFAAACGSSVACTATVAKVAYPELAKRGYPRELSMGAIAAGGTLGILIPPSLQFVVYGAVVGESVGKLFIAGVIPGIMLLGLFSLYVGATALLRPQTFPPREKGNLIGNLKGLISIWPVVVLVLLVMGAIYAGISTPTEAAALGALGAIIITLIFRPTRFFRALREAALGTIATTGMVLFIIMGATILSISMTHLGATKFIVNTILSFGLSPLVIFIGLCVVYFILGMFLDAVSMMVLTLPIFYPLMMQLGFNSIWLGVVVVILLEQAFLTPPVGFGLFILSGVSKRPIEEVTRGVLPFVGILFGAVFILYFFPDIALWLVSMMRK